jgi:glucose/arabinose dehydrogenase/mono/diheme cytochrome c family protein
MAPRFAPALIAISILLSPGLLAQRGDRAGEVQQPPPEHLVVPPAPALSVEEAMKTFKIAPGFHLDVVAAEPLVFDPIAMLFGPDGRIWVVEMRAYMPNVEGQGENEPIGSISVLEDTDGDGRMDKRTVFLDSLVMPRALSLVDDGLLVAEPTHLWFCRDTNGDGVADQKVEIANDYGNTTNPEHNANGLMWAMDNWIYSANHTVRFRYEGGGKFRRDTTITRGQWGITQDDIGRLYYNSNSDPLRADLVPSAYLKRNPNFSAAGANVQIAPAKLEVWPGRVTPGINRGYKMLREDGTLPTVTAACAPVIYRGALFPAEFQGDAFICEPAGNLVKRIKLEEHGGVIEGRNAYDHAEFLTSTDERFRPVNLINGPDGALYLVDMYRGIIQHRTYVTTYLRKQIEERHLERPVGMGRIYRIAPDKAPLAAIKPDLAGVAPAQLVQRLTAPDGWTRDTAQRLLVEKRDTAVVPALRELATNAKANPLGRLHALWTLDGVDGLDQPTVIRALNDADPRVQAAAVRLSEKWLAAPGDAGTFAAVKQLVAPGAAVAPAVVRQIALSLGEVRTPEAMETLRSLAVNAGNLAFVPDAIVSGIGGQETEFAAALANEVTSGKSKGAATLALATAAVLKSNQPAKIDRVLALAADDKNSEVARTAVLSGVRLFLPKTPDGRTLAGSLAAEPAPLVALAKASTPLGQNAAELVALLRWPGKPGMATAAVTELTPEQKALFEKGRAQFAALCAACHQPNGQGLAGLAPSLINSRWVLGDPRVLARIVLCGKAQDNLQMPGWRAALDDEAIAGALTFIRRSWGHEASAVSPAVVAEARQATLKREEPWSDADLEELMQDLGPARRERRRQN